MTGEIAPGGHPQKAEGLEVHLVDGQCVVFDPAADRVHYLNPTAALVLELCDGSRSAGDIALVVQEAYQLPTLPLDDVYRCLSGLREMEVIH